MCVAMPQPGELLAVFLQGSPTLHLLRKASDKIPSFQSLNNDWGLFDTLSRLLDRSMGHFD
jgi:hypothetical protein